MLIIDDLLLFPIRGPLWVLKQIHEIAEQELANEAEAVTAELSELYMRLETGQIAEAEFDSQEKELLDRLEAITAREEQGEAEEGEDEKVLTEKAA